MAKSQSYDEFVDKFKPKLTTDDCYTPPLVYEAVLKWCRDNIDMGDAEVVRPFYPGGDYQSYDYPDGYIVMDNPPFSIFAEIRRWYQERGIRYFLFVIKKPYSYRQMRATNTPICILQMPSMAKYQDMADYPCLGWKEGLKGLF